MLHTNLASADSRLNPLALFTSYLRPLSMYSSGALLGRTFGVQIYDDKLEYSASP